METQDKQLLLKDLSAKLPYGVILHNELKDYNIPLKGISDLESTEIVIGEECQHHSTRMMFRKGAKTVVEFKPYFRPMSSMTEEEIKEWDSICVMMRNMPIESIPMIERFVNSKHLDYHGLIPMGLALPAPDGMYDFK